jgi:hypothetical protein
MSSQELFHNNSLPDLIVNQCPFGCENCPGVWKNRQIGHRIICKCVCDHVQDKNKDENLALDGASLVGNHTERQAAAIPSHNNLTNKPKTKGVADVVK